MAQEQVEERQQQPQLRRQQQQQQQNQHQNHQQRQRNPETYAIVVRYTRERLSRDGYEWTPNRRGGGGVEGAAAINNRRVVADAADAVDGQVEEEEERRPPTPPAADVVDEDIHATMRRVTAEFEQRFAEAFEELGGQLEIDRDSAFQTFQGILGATFQDGVSWGRIVALMCLSGALASKCVALHMAELVDEVVEWTVSYVENHLSDWISDHEGWRGFLNFYQNQDQVDGSWLNPRRVLGYAAGLVGVLTIGAFLGQRA